MTYFQLRRLELAIREETKKSVDSVNDPVSKKRETEDENVDPNGPEKIKAVDRFGEMGVRQLRDEAVRLGLSAGGSKKELLERLRTGSQNDSIDVSEGIYVQFVL